MKLTKIELIKECQRLMIKNDYSVMSVKIIGEFMKKNLETSDEYINKPEFKDYLKSLGSENGK